MKPRLPFKLKLLLVSSHLVCVLALIECASILWVAIKYPPTNFLPTVINITLFGIFFTFSILVIRIIRNYYPANEIPRSTKITFRIASIIAWICIGFFFLAIVALFADSTRNPDFKIIFENVMTAILFLSFLGSFVLQILNSFLALGLIRGIDKTHRQQMFESI